MARDKGIRCEVVYKGSRPNKVVRVASVMRRSDNLANCALILADSLGDHSVVGVLHNGRWID